MSSIATAKITAFVEWTNAADQVVSVAALPIRVTHQHDLAPGDLVEINATLDANGQWSGSVLLQLRPPVASSKGQPEPARQQHSAAPASPRSFSAGLRSVTPTASAAAPAQAQPASPSPVPTTSAPAASNAPSRAQRFAAAGRASATPSTPPAAPANTSSTPPHSRPVFAGEFDEDIPF